MAFHFWFNTRALYLFFAFVQLVVVPIESRAAESTTIKVSAAVFALNTAFRKIKDPFEKATGIKLDFITKENASGLSALEAFQNVVDDKAEVGAAGVFWLDWKKILEDGKVTEDKMKLVTYRVVARDLAIVATGKNGVRSLSDEQIIKLFTGKVANWKEIGGPDLPAVMVLADNLRATEKIFPNLALRGQPVAVEKAKYVADIKAVVDYLATNPGAFAYMPQNELDAARINAPEHRPLVRPVTVITKGEPSANVKKLFDFIKSDGKKYGVNP